MIDTSIVALTPIEYRLVIKILTSYVQWQTAQQAGCFLVDKETLQQAAGRTARQHIKWHLSNVNAKLAPFGMRVQAVVGAGYTLVVEHTPLRRDGQFAPHVPHLDIDGSCIERKDGKEESDAPGSARSTEANRSVPTAFLHDMESLV